MFLVTSGVLAAAGSAQAQNVVVIGPNPAWVVPVQPKPLVAEAAGFSATLIDHQVRLDENGVHTFDHQVVRLTSAAAVQNFGTVGVAWQPAYGAATVHQLVIRRGGQEIDVLKSGAKFNVLQREQGLEALQLDGVLTAILQVPDLRVGDEVDFSYTIDRRNSALGEHRYLEDRFSTAPVDRLFVRYSWPTARKAVWRVGSRLPAVAPETTAVDTAIVLTGDSLVLPALIAGAPARFFDETTVSISDYADWRQVAQSVAPLFESATKLASGSTVNDEIRKIAASSADPKVRAQRALQLVQSQVRYFARLDGLGGYVPESADAVWAARSGDCKGKTALLLALLRGLGIEAEPALVSLTRGDGLDKALPSLSRFDHVIVRASIAGKVYWLDGARTGDRRLETIQPPPFRWALPLGLSQRTLEALPLLAPVEPEAEYRLDLDARAGLDKPAQAKGDAVIRGDEATTIRNSVALMSLAVRDQTLTKLWKERHDWVTIDTVSYEEDAVTGEVRIGFTGTGVMDWRTNGGRYESNKSQMGVSLAPEREAKVASLAPVAVDARYDVVRQSILLPDQGRGFALQAPAIDETIGGVAYARSTTLEGERFDMVATTRSAPGEISYAQAEAADKQADTLFAKRAYLVRPQGAASLSAINQDALQGVYDLTQAKQFDAALTALDKVMPTPETTAGLAALRGLILYALGRLPEASAAFDQGLATDPNNLAALSGKADLLLQQKRPGDALILADRWVLLAPQDQRAYRLRAEVRRQSGDGVGAISDWDIVIDKQGGDPDLYLNRLNTLSGLGRADQAIAESATAAAKFPQSAALQAARAGLLGKAGRLDEAAKAAAGSLKIEPNADAYIIRAYFGLSGSDKATLEDLLAAIALQPSHSIDDATFRRALTAPGAHQKLDAAYASAKPEDDAEAERIAYMRGALASAAGDPTPLLALYDAAVAKARGEPSPLNSACWARAVRGVELERALKDCDGAIALAPEAAYLDSRGLVRLRLRNYAGAIADYDAALARRPTQSTSLYGRGLAKRAQCDTVGGDADLAAALKADPRVADQFADMGLRP